MTQSLTITQLDRAATEWIEQEAQRTGMPIEAIARQLIYRGLEVERQRDRQQRYHDLDALAGTWSTEVADEFRQTIADLNQIDPALWQ
jgi:hypothetical protein